jgi:phosphatidylglycerophosphate synthase
MLKEFFNFRKYEQVMGKTFSFWSPMTWTYIGFFFSPLGFIAVLRGELWIGLALFVIGGIIDEIDGKVARYTKQSTYLGGFVDGVVDRFTDSLLILCFFFLDLPDVGVEWSLILFVLLFVTLMPPFIVAYANHRKAVPDPTEKVIWRFSFRIEYYFMLLFALAFTGIHRGVAAGLLLATLLLNGATVVQSIILAFIKSKNYPQRLEDKKQ